MQFGLTNAPATLQNTLDIVLAGHTWQSCLASLDDFFIFSKEIEVHYSHVDKVLDCRASTGVIVKLRNCGMFTVSVLYLGHMIEPSKLGIQKATVAALEKTQQPTNKKEL